MTCKKGLHEFRGDENARARLGWCPHCLREAQRRYDSSEKGKARQITYNDSPKGRERHNRYLQSPKGWAHTLNDRRAKALARRKRRKEAEDSYGPLQGEVTGGPTLEPDSPPTHP